MNRPGLLAGTPSEIVFPVDLLGRMRALAGAHASGSASARVAVLEAFAECLRSLGYGEALEEAQRLIAQPPAVAPPPFAASPVPAPEV